MKNVREWQSLVREVDGATAIEYALIAASVAVVIFGVVAAVGTEVLNLWQSVADSFQG